MSFNQTVDQAVKQGLKEVLKPFGGADLSLKERVQVRTALRRGLITEEEIAADFTGHLVAQGVAVDAITFDPDNLRKFIDLFIEYFPKILAILLPLFT